MIREVVGREREEGDRGGVRGNYALDSATNVGKAGELYKGKRLPGRCLGSLAGWQAVVVDWRPVEMEK